MQYDALNVSEPFYAWHMSHKIEFRFAPSDAIEDALSRRLEEIRLRRNITQSRLAREAGISRSTMTRLAQPGKGISLDSFIRILKALDLGDNLQALLPDPGFSPLEELERGSQPARQRARRKQRDQKKWTWEEPTPGDGKGL